MNVEKIVVGLIALNGGTLVGRTRLQKQAYLLDKCGASFGLDSLIIITGRIPSTSSKD